MKRIVLIILIIIFGSSYSQSTQDSISKYERFISTLKDVETEEDVSLLKFSESDQDSIPKITNYVTDAEDILDRKEEIELLKSILNFYLKSDYSIYILSVNNINKYENFDDFALSIVQKYNVGHCWIIFNTKIRQISIQNSDFIREKFTDGESANILNGIIIPKFKTGNYFEGLYDAIEAIKKELN